MEAEISLPYSIYCTLLLIGLFATSCYWDLAPANSLAGSTGETLQRCWCDFNGGHLLASRTFGSNFTTTAAGAASAKCADNATALTATIETQACNASSLQPIVKGLGEQTKDGVRNWLESTVDKVSQTWTEEYLGFKITL